MIVVQDGWLYFSITQWKLLVRAATVGCSHFWDSWATISTFRSVNLLVLLCLCKCVCCTNCQYLAVFLSLFFFFNCNALGCPDSPHPRLTRQHRSSWSGVFEHINNSFVIPIDRAAACKCWVLLHDQHWQLNEKALSHRAGKSSESPLQLSLEYSLSPVSCTSAGQCTALFTVEC